MNVGFFPISSSPEELDSLIQSFEYENQQSVKFIEKENQLLEAIEKEMVQKKTEIDRLQTSTTHLDEETKRAHRQFTQNRGNCESLRKTASVLHDHEVALMKKFNALVISGEQERSDRENALQHYTNIWEDYKAKYESFPISQTYLQKQRETETSSVQLEEVKTKLEELKAAISSLQEPGVDIYDMKKFSAAVAELKLETRKNCLKVTQRREEWLGVQNMIKEIREKNRRLLEDQQRALEAKRQAELEASRESESHAAGTCDNRQKQDLTEGRSAGGLETISPEKSTLAHMYDGDQDVSTLTTPSEGQQRFLPTSQSITPSPQTTIQLTIPGLQAKQRGQSPYTAPFSYMPEQSRVTPVIIQPLSRAPSSQTTQPQPQDTFKHPNLLEHGRGKLPPLPVPRSDACISQSVPETQRFPSQRHDTPATDLASAAHRMATIPPYGSRSPQIPVSRELPRNTAVSVHQPDSDNFIPQERAQPQVTPGPVPCTEASTGSRQTPAYGPQTTTFQPKTPEHSDGGRHGSQPTTPREQSVFLNTTSHSPFDLEKHLKMVRELNKSPATPYYSTRPMFAAQQSAPEQEMQEDQSTFDGNQFMQNLFLDGRGDGTFTSFQTNVSSPPINKSKEKSFLGVPDSPAIDSLSSTVSFDFGGGSGNTCTSGPQSSSMLSMFGPSGVQSDTPSGDSGGFSFNFGSPSIRSPPQSDSLSEFRLF